MRFSGPVGSVDPGGSNSQEGCESPPPKGPGFPGNTSLAGGKPILRPALTELVEKGKPVNIPVLTRYPRQRRLEAGRFQVGRAELSLCLTTQGPWSVVMTRNGSS
jgi:hypothetical protein